MPIETTPTAILEKLKTPGAALHPAEAANIELSPPLVLAAALLYMMLSNGQVEKSEIDQLQSVIGKNADLLRCAVDYVQSVPVEQFVANAPAALETADRLCVLTNMCDAMLSDGQADAVELDLLAQLTAAFGFTDEDFQPYYEAIALKNDRTILGPFDAARLAAQQATPHLAMAASLIYMMASDGSLGPEEIGRLQAMIGEYEGLQKVAVKYALKVKSEKFIASASKFLNAEQKIFVLTNVCDIMLADGVIEIAEKTIFQSMRTSFGYTEEEFEPYYTAVTAKNIKSFDTEKFTYVRDSRLPDDSDPDDIFSIPGATFSASSDGTSNIGSRTKFGTSVSRAMRANIVKVSTDFGSSKKLNRISDNSHFPSQSTTDAPAFVVKPRQADPYDEPSFDAAPSQTSARRPIGSGGRGQAIDTTQRQPLPTALIQSRVAESDSSPSASRHRGGAADSTARTEPLLPHRQRRPTMPAHGQSTVHHHSTVPGQSRSQAHSPVQSAEAAAVLERTRDRLKTSQVVNAEIRQQLDHYEATGKMLRRPSSARQLGRQAPNGAPSDGQAVMQPETNQAQDPTPKVGLSEVKAPSSREIADKLRAAASNRLRKSREAMASRLSQVTDSLQPMTNTAQPENQGAEPPKADSTAKPPAHAFPRAVGASPAWRVAVPIAILSSALMAGTASVMVGLGAPQPDSGWSEAPANTASLAPCLLRNALSKQSAFPRASAGCASLPQPQSSSASLGRTMRNFLRVRFL